jgi:sensor c-di-GMP phosphodiesterase-like protein
MAHTLGLEVIAEGVETSKQAVFLEEIKCQTMQGYFFSKALRAADTIPFLQHRQCDTTGASSYAATSAADALRLAAARGPEAK